MVDRELLELAAKAAGLRVSLRAYPTLEPVELDIKKGYWNPLTDDGDALRLAVKLNMEIDISKNAVAVRHYTGIKILVERAINEDNCAVTRHAIVRAAAEIGEAL